MKAEVINLAEQILNFPINDRAYLAEVLLESLDYEEVYTISKEWISEINKRCDDIGSGVIKLMPGEESLAKLKNKYL